MPETVTRVSFIAERLENIALDVLFPTLAGDCWDQLTSGYEAKIAVGPMRPETPQRLDVLHPRNQLRTCEIRWRKEQQIALAHAKPTAVREDVADRDLLGGIGSYIWKLGM